MKIVETLNNPLNRAYTEVICRRIPLNKSQPKAR